MNGGNRPRFPTEDVGNAVYGGAMTEIWEPPIAGTEAEHLLAALDRMRWTFRYLSQFIHFHRFAHHDIYVTMAPVMGAEGARRDGRCRTGKEDALEHQGSHRCGR